MKLKTFATNVALGGLFYTVKTMQAITPKGFAGFGVGAVLVWVL